MIKPGLAVAILHQEVIDMRAFQGQFSDNVAISRTPKQKELLIRELEQTLVSCKIKPLRQQLSSRVQALREEIRADRREEAAKMEKAAVQVTMRQMEVERRPRRHNLIAAANAVLGGAQ